MLRSCSSWDAYRQIYSGNVDPRRVAEFLLLSDEFPRSVRFCLASFDSALRRISGVPEHKFSNKAERLSGRLLAELQFSTIEEVFEEGLHGYLDRLQLEINDLGEALFDAYIFQPFNTPLEEFAQQQQQQQ